MTGKKKEKKEGQYHKTEIREWGLRTDPASYIFTNVTFPALEPPPPALLTSPATRPDPHAYHGADLVFLNSSKNCVSSSPSQRSLPYKHG